MYLLHFQKLVEARSRIQDLYLLYFLLANQRLRPLGYCSPLYDTFLRFYETSILVNNRKSWNISLLARIRTLNLPKTSLQGASLSLCCYFAKLISTCYGVIITLVDGNTRTRWYQINVCNVEIFISKYLENPKS